MMKWLCAFVFLLFFLPFTEAASVDKFCVPSFSVAPTSAIYVHQVEHRPNHLIRLFRKKLNHTRRAMAAALAFPLPFGVLALHRIYLGTRPHVPVAYIGTVGGVFGILPFVDFCVLILDADVDRFYNNGKVFMWIND